MSEKLFKFLLSELSTVRLVCKDKSCGAITEMTLEKLRTRFSQSDPCCPVCRAEFGDPATSSTSNPLRDFAQAVRALQARQQFVEVEFVLPDKS